MHLDYHVEYDKHYYSVPYQLVKEEVMVHAGDTTVALFHQGEQVALHPRSHAIGGHSTDINHMAKAHQKQAQWTPPKFLFWAQEIGEHTVVLIDYHQSITDHSLA